MTKIVPLDKPDLLGHVRLDMRVSSATGKDLREEIAESVEHSQAFIQQTLPDILVLTQKQFVSIQDFTETMLDTEYRLYITPLNAMDVVVDREIDKVAEVDEAMQLYEDLEIVDHNDKDDKLGSND